jgi:glycosyltransferase 2 family protein
MSLKQLAVGVQAVFAAALLALLFHRFDWSALQSALVRVPFHFYVTSLAILVVGRALYVLKWQVVLSAMQCRQRFRTLAPLYLLGTFFNNFLPTMIGGDAARV